MSEDGGEDRPMTRAERIAAARARLAELHAECPGLVHRYQARMAALTASAKRERARFEYLVLGVARPTERVTIGKRGGRRKPKTVEVPVQLPPGIEEAVKLRERWSHKTQGTVQTWNAAEGTHQGALAQLHKNGTINGEQLEWAAQIANVHRSIESDVAVKVASLEARIDQSGRPPVIGERIHRVRMHRAYGFWRDMLPAPKSLVLDMIVGDTIGYTVAATRYRVHKRKAKRLLLEAIQRWPLSVAHAFSVVDQPTVDAMNMARAPIGGPNWIAPLPQEYERVRQEETGRDKTNEPYLLPPIDPVFLDERGILRPWDEIAAIIRERVFGAPQMDAAE